jgi:hypothetical protein
MFLPGEPTGGDQTKPCLCLVLLSPLARPSQYVDALRMRGRYVCLRPAEGNGGEREDDADEKVEGFGGQVRVCGKGRGGRQTSQHTPGRLRRPFQSHVDSCFKDGSNTKHCAMTLDMREAPMPVVCAFLLCPSPFQRLSVAVLIYFIYICLDIHLSHTQPSPPCRVLRHATHRSKPHHPVPAHSHLQVKWAVESVDHRRRCTSHSIPIRALSNLSIAPASKRLSRHSRTARPSHWHDRTTGCGEDELWRCSDRPRSRRPVRRLLAFYLRHHHRRQRT